MELSADFIMSEIASVAPRLREIGVTRIGLFGSAVRGEIRPDSDLDFLVDFREYTFDSLMDTVFLLEELFGRHCDIVPIKSVRPELKDSIMSEVRFASSI